MHLLTQPNVSELDLFKKVLSVCTSHRIPHDLVCVALKGFKQTPSPIYHGELHTLTMFLNAYWLTQMEAPMPMYARSVLVACLFHDSNHTQGRGNCTDSNNIASAIATFRSAWETVPCELPQDERAEIERLICITEYPYTRPATTLSEKIMRDADLLTHRIGNKELRDQLFVGLFNEMKLKAPGLTLEGFVGQNIAFIEDIQFRTDTGKAWKDSDEFKTNLATITPEGLMEAEAKYHHKQSILKAGSHVEKKPYKLVIQAKGTRKT